ncbi:MAG: PAS domain-containing protein, partial [Fibrobacter sp.]|nr:PAS domain-containing protein [Fibrobacter sp.]
MRNVQDIVPEMTCLQTKMNTRTEDNSNSVDWNSVKLLLLLTGPASIMAIILFNWPDIRWIGEIQFTAIGILGAFTQMLLSVFIMARYRSKQGIMFISAGLLSMALINGIQAVLPPESSEFLWLHSFAGICGSFFFSIYVAAVRGLIPSNILGYVENRSKKLLLAVAALAAGISYLILGYTHAMPLLVIDGAYTNIAWIVNGIPVLLYLFSGISLFLMYRKTAAPELFIFTAMVIFLFQASEVIYFASLWSVIWWFWLGLRLAVYVSVLVLVLREYIQISGSLACEIEERTRAEQALRKAEEDWRNSFNAIEEVMMIIDSHYTIDNVNASGLVLLKKEKNEIIGRNIYEIFPRLERETCPLERSFETSRTEHIEWYDSDIRKHFLIKSSPVVNTKGRVLKYVFLMDDITEEFETKAKEKL